MSKALWLPKSGVCAFGGLLVPFLVMLLTVVVLAGSGCGTVVQQKQEATLYINAYNSLQSGHFKDAIERFDELERLYPYSSLARRADMMLIYSHFLYGQYREADAVAQRYIQLFPGDENIVYVRYMRSISLYNLVISQLLDQGIAKESLVALREVMILAPNTPYARDARAKILILRDFLASQEMRNAYYYENLGLFFPVLIRLTSVVKNYEDTRYIQEALYRISSIYASWGIVDEAQAVAALLGANYPQSQWYERAYETIEKFTEEKKMRRSSPSDLYIFPHQDGVSPGKESSLQ